MHMTEAEFRAFLMKTGQDSAAYKLPRERKKPAKYRNKKVYVFENGFISSNKEDTEIHGKADMIFDSVKEYDRWNELLLMQQSGVVSNLQRQIPFIIQPAFTKGRKRHRAISYKAGHVYCIKGKEIIEDTKGFDVSTQKYITTKDFNLKWKLLQRIYPDKEFRIY